MFPGTPGRLQWTPVLLRLQDHSRVLLQIWVCLSVSCFTLYSAGLKNVAPSRKIKEPLISLIIGVSWGVEQISLGYFWFMSLWWLFCCCAWLIYYLVPEFFTLQCHFGAIRDISEAWVCQVWPGRSGNLFALYHPPGWADFFFLSVLPPSFPSLLSLVSSFHLFPSLLSHLHPSAFFFCPDLCLAFPYSLFSLAPSHVSFYLSLSCVPIFLTFVLHCFNYRVELWKAIESPEVLVTLHCCCLSLQCERTGHRSPCVALLLLQGMGKDLFLSP